MTKIEWTERTWNPVRGCSIVSPGCVNCYAMKQAHRFSGEGRAYHGLTKLTKQGPQWTGEVVCDEAKLLEPLSWRTPARVFVNSMSDLFHESVPDAFIDRVFAVMALAPQHTFQILTKRAERMRDFFANRSAYYDEWYRRVMAIVRAWKVEAVWTMPTDYDGQYALGQSHGALTCGAHETRFLPNVWLGVSCENQQTADERIPLLLQTPAAIRFVSAEPLLGPINLHAHVCVNGSTQRPEQRFASICDSNGLLHWVIVGGESGPGARIFDIAWGRSIVQQCQSAGVPVFVKQLGTMPMAGRMPHPDDMFLRLRDRKGGDPAEWPADLRVREFPR